MRFVYLMIVLGFPLLDLYATSRIARWSGIPIWVWLGLPLIAGFLLLLPGVISDVIALVLLALPLNVGNGERIPGIATAGRSAPPRRSALDGEFRRLD